MSGTCGEAEQEALGACEELRPWMRREFGWPLVELGNIRLRKGDLPGAEEAFIAAHERAWSPHPGLALLRLEQGDAGTASTMIADAIAHPFDIPSKERPPFGDLRLAPLLDAQAAIAAVTGDVDTLRTAAAALQTDRRLLPESLARRRARRWPVPASHWSRATRNGRSMEPPQRPRPGQTSVRRSRRRPRGWCSARHATSGEMPQGPEWSGPQRHRRSSASVRFAGRSVPSSVPPVLDSVDRTDPANPSLDCHVPVRGRHPDDRVRWCSRADA